MALGGVRGRSAPVAIYEAYEFDAAALREHKARTRRDYEDAYMLYLRGDLRQAEARLRPICQANDADCAAQRFLERIEASSRSHRA